MGYKRVLLKLSGEQFAGSQANGIDGEFLEHLAKEIKEVCETTKVQLAIVVGGGNYIRGTQVAQQGIQRATADYMGMLATLMNGMALADVIENIGQPTRILSRIRTDAVAEPYIRNRGIKHLEKGRVVILAGGTGNPYVTTDTAAVSGALELNCEVVLKATKVDGVYDADPATHPDAHKLESISFSQALADPSIRVMDKMALSLAMENELPIIVFDLLTDGNIAKVIKGEPIGTTIKP